MPHPTPLVDRIVESICHWLEDLIPRRHALAVVGEHLAGTRDQVLLPADRRTGLSFMSGAGGFGEAGAAARQNAESRAFAANKLDPSADEKSCNFWAYCNMTGYPCTVCGGTNGFGATGTNPRGAGTSCPSGSKVGQYWSGCCQKPGGSIHYVAWLDCGRPTSRVCGPQWCDNYPGVKDWTIGAGKYYCTVSVTIPSKDSICA